MNWYFITTCSTRIRAHCHWQLSLAICTVLYLDVEPKFTSSSCDMLTRCHICISRSNASYACRNSANALWSGSHKSSFDFYLFLDCEAIIPTTSISNNETILGLNSKYSLTSSSVSPSIMLVALAYNGTISFLVATLSCQHSYFEFVLPRQKLITFFCNQLCFIFAVHSHDGRPSISGYAPCASNLDITAKILNECP